MIISRTPFRVSLFGGSTDYPVWFKEHGGQVLGTTIDKYCYISARYLPPYFTHKSRIVYSIEEWVNYHRDIKHPAVRECLKYLDIRQGVEICHQSDLLARKGIGSSSAFVVGLLNALGTLTHQGLDKKGIAELAILIEQEWIKENVGCQDQYLSALGGFNHLKFDPDGTITATEVRKPPDLISHLMLFDTGTSRIASEIAAKQIEETPKKEQELSMMCSFVGMAVRLLNGGNVKDIGRLLHESWQLKKSLTNKISTPLIDEIYETGIKAGALGGKLLGAGGGGYMLFFAEPDKHNAVKQALNKLKYIPFEFENTGTQIIFNDERDRLIIG